MSLAQLRAELRGALEGAGLVAVDREPARISPPVALIGPGTPYIGDAETFAGSRVVRMRVRLVVPNGESALEELEELVEAAIPAVELIGDDVEDRRAGNAWSVLEAGEPYVLMIGTTAFPALDVVVTTSAVF